MNEAIFRPLEEHLADPLPPARIAMWFVLASDLMFFVGLIGAFAVLRTGNRDLFENHMRGLNRAMEYAGAMTLVAGSVTMAVAVRAIRNHRPRLYLISLIATLACGSTFIGLRSIEYRNALSHHTIAARERSTDPLILFDGDISWLNGQRILTGYAAPLPQDFDPHIVSENDVARLSPLKTGSPPTLTLPSEIFQDIPYGPSKNIFYAIWYTLTGAHLFHVAIGMIAVAVLLVQALRKRASPNHAELVGIYWHFIVFIGVALLPLFYQHLI